MPAWVPVDDIILQWQTGSRTNTPSYLDLSRLNFDHFGADAHAAYNAGHYCAMEEAAKPKGDLDVAYAMNAFADHYLGDLFSAGHMRTPRRLLHYDGKPKIFSGIEKWIIIFPDYLAGVCMFKPLSMIPFADGS